MAKSIDRKDQVKLKDNFAVFDKDAGVFPGITPNQNKKRKKIEPQ